MTSSPTAERARRARSMSASTARGTAVSVPSRTHSRAAGVFPTESTMTVTDARTVATPPARIGVRLRRSVGLARNQRLARAPVMASAPPTRRARCVQSIASATEASFHTRKALPGASSGSQNRNQRSMSGPSATTNGTRTSRSRRDSSRPCGKERERPGDDHGKDGLGMEASDALLAGDEDEEPRAEQRTECGQGQPQPVGKAAQRG